MNGHKKSPAETGQLVKPFLKSAQFAIIFLNQSLSASHPNTLQPLHLHKSLDGHHQYTLTKKPGTKHKKEAERKEWNNAMWPIILLAD